MLTPPAGPSGPSGPVEPWIGNRFEWILGARAGDSLGRIEW